MSSVVPHSAFDTADKVAKVLPIGVFTAFQYIVSQITESFCDPVQVRCSVKRMYGMLTSLSCLFLRRSTQAVHALIQPRCLESRDHCIGRSLCSEEALALHLLTHALQGLIALYNHNTSVLISAAD